MHRAKKPSIADLNQHLTCKLCKGYFIDATTIIECLHSFCRSCIVKYLETSKYCPVCDVQVHKTKPLLNIRADKTLQDVVYKLVPRLYSNEVQRRREFYLSHPDLKPNEQIVEDYQHILSSDESISLTMSYYGCKESTRYLRCPAAVSVGHLQKLIRAKYGLFDNHHVDILYNQDCLNATLTLMDIGYIYSWKRKAPMELSYRIYENTSKVSKIETNQTNNNNWKEVQLRISENGEMSIVQDVASELVNNNYKAETDKNKVKELPEPNAKSEAVTSAPISVTSSITKTVYSTISAKCSVSSEVKSAKEDEKGVKRKAEAPPEDKPPKQTILNHSINLHNLSNNHPLKKHSLAKEGEEFPKPIIINKSITLPTSNSSRPGTPKPPTKPCYMPKTPIINVPKPSTSKNDKVQIQSCSSTTKTEVKAAAPVLAPPPPPPSPPPKQIKSKPSTPIGYKTLRDPPKSWNSQIAKANVNKPIHDTKSIKPAKFFKMRNNMPRYLGNPASGVKPMYQVHANPDKEKERQPEQHKGEIRKHSIVKIDPKTLKPISEKAPETTSLSNSGDLKINTSSVSIFNPLKLQNSPKGERKSPKSPHSPKVTASPPAKRDKPNLSFTPPNPFVPNLTSPTMSPKQFLYPTGHPGFPPYDPRVMAAAYQHLFYGQRMPFPPPGLNLDLNQRKGFDLAGPTSPKLGGMPQPLSPQQPPLKLPTPDQLGIQTSSRTLCSNSNSTVMTNSFKSQPVPKKPGKESGKNEKSLKNAVEKLTQNRVKEIKNEAAKKSSNETKPEADKEKESRSNATPTPPPPPSQPPPQNQTQSAKVEDVKEQEEEKEKKQEEKEKKQEENETKEVKVDSDRKDNQETKSENGSVKAEPEAKKSVNEETVKDES